jgi:Ice-binding-like
MANKISQKLREQFGWAFGNRDNKSEMISLLLGQEIGEGLQVNETGPTARMGVSTLVAGTVTVANTSVDASTRIFLTAQNSSLAATGVPNLLSAASYAVIASSTITNTGTTNLTGNLALSPGTSVTGSPTVSGTSNIANSAAAQAVLDAQTAYNQIVALAPTQNLSGQDLGTVGTLGPGVYKFNSSAALTGTLTLNGGGNPNAVFIFQIGSTLTTASASSIVLTNSANAGNVFFQVGSSATIGTTSALNGNIIALASITMNTGATNNGGLMALTGAVTLAGNTSSTATENGPVLGGGTPGFLHVSNIVPGTGFTINSSSITDASTVAWLLVEAVTQSTPRY